MWSTGDARAAAGQPGGQSGRRLGKDPREAQIAALTLRAEKAEAELARTKAALDLVRASTRALGDALRERGHAAAVDAVIHPMVERLAQPLPVVAACRLLGPLAGWALPLAAPGRG